MTTERHIGFELRAVNNLIKRYVAKTRPPELEDQNSIHGWAIGYFYDHREEEIFQRDFEAYFSIRRSTATNILKLMEKKGLITRQSVPRDARLKRICLTEKAVRIHEIITKDIGRLERELAQGISPEEQMIFFRILDKIKANLEVNND
ncbi:MAG: MarR family transcriptional regulator [Oscillospiraceae bacterium]|nr:MarR family transcriptional regulator [Oscillospiraceae bacterium]